MTKFMYKRWMTVLCVLAITCFMAILAPVFTANANTEKTLADINFSMVKGASMRVMETSGIRYSAVLSEEDAQWLNDNYDTVTYGTFIMPADYEVNYGALIEETLFGKNPVYFWDGKEKTTETVEVLQMYGELKFDQEEQKMMVKGSIAPVYTENLNREFVGICYAELVKGGDVDYIFATPNDNQRTVVYVGQKSIELGGLDNDEKVIVEGLINDYFEAYKEANAGATPTVSYTVNQIFDDGTATNQIVVDGAELNSTVTLDLQDYAKDGYTIDQAKSIVSGTAYAQDKLVLDVYYNNIDYAKKSTWLSSDPGRFETVNYVGDNTWIASPVATSTGNFYNIMLSTDAVKELMAENKTVVSFTFEAAEGTEITDLALSHAYCIYPANADVGVGANNSVIVQFTLTEDMTTNAPNIMFYAAHTAGGSMVITLNAQEKQSTWLSSDPGRFETVNYVGDNTWIASPVATSTGNFYNIMLSTDAVKELMAENKTVVSFTFEAAEGTEITDLALSHAYCIYPANADVGVGANNSVIVQFTLTEDMTTNAPNIMFYAAHTAGGSMVITLNAQELTCGKGWLAGYAEGVEGANVLTTYNGYDSQNYDISFVNDVGTKQYQITAKAVNELIAKGYSKVNMTVTVKEGEAFLSNLSVASAPIYSSLGNNVDSKIYDLTADTPIFISFWIGELSQDQSVAAGFSEIPPMTGFIVQLVGVN